MNSEHLKGVLQQFVSRPLPQGRPRDLQLPLGTGKVIGLAGVRRSGKTFLFFHTIQRLLAQGVARRQLIYQTTCAGAASRKWCWRTSPCGR